uniref:Uncharacterized protein n=1 Tax=Nelumbo nucifera TaxID=4432 RepID=A0A822ZKW4_NELNU|nr:TPA_asm: hypothetical protein HUJ06_003757 [Nelumbo nucifera]
MFGLTFLQLQQQPVSQDSSYSPPVPPSAPNTASALVVAARPKVLLLWDHSTGGVGKTLVNSLQRPKALLLAELEGGQAPTGF